MASESVENRMFELFLEWCKKETINPNYEWVWTKNKVYMDGEDVTKDYVQWMHIKLEKGDTSWLN
jgi:hypothetical protein